jgi:hypothetical protein
LPDRQPLSRDRKNAKTSARELHYQLRPSGSDAQGQQAQLFKQGKIAAGAGLLDNQLIESKEGLHECLLHQCSIARQD